MFIHEITNKRDEYFTPAYAVEPVLKYLPERSVIWCPFDTNDSSYVTVLRAAGHDVHFTHINNGQDFFTTEPPVGVQYIISNPPYSQKTAVFTRLFDLQIPFAMLVGIFGLFESQVRFNLFLKHDFEVLYFNKRINYYLKDRNDQLIETANPPFSSSYVCAGILPKQMIFEYINKK